MKGKIIGIILASLVSIGILVLLICNWTGAFAETNPETYQEKQIAESKEVSNCKKIIKAPERISGNKYGAYFNARIIGTRGGQNNKIITFKKLYSDGTSTNVTTNFLSAYVNETDINATIGTQFSFYDYDSTKSFQLIPADTLIVDGITYYYSGVWQINNTEKYTNKIGSFNMSYSETRKISNGTPSFIVLYGIRKTIPIQIYPDILFDLGLGDITFKNTDNSTITITQGSYFTFNSYANWTPSIKENGAYAEITGITLQYTLNNEKRTKTLYNDNLVYSLPDEITLAVPTLELYNFGTIFDLYGEQTYQEGYDTGFNVGEERGYTSGYNNGYNAGTADGYAEALEDLNNSENITQQDSALLASRNIIKSVISAMDVKLFGFLSILDIIGIVVVLGLVLFVIKLIRS